MNKLLSSLFAALAMISSVSAQEVTLRQRLKPWHTLTGHTDEVRSIVFSHDGKMLASASLRHVKLWDVATGKNISTLGDAIFDCIAFSPKGENLVAGGGGGGILIWDVATGKSIAELKGHRQNVCSVAFSPDGKILATASDDATIRL
jgi:WD40 repeat protein